MKHASIKHQGDGAMALDARLDVIVVFIMWFDLLLMLAAGCILLGPSE